MKVDPLNSKRIFMPSAIQNVHVISFRPGKPALIMIGEDISQMEI